VLLHFITFLSPAKVFWHNIQRQPVPCKSSRTHNPLS
jgi:hypothetical protein